MQNAIEFLQSQKLLTIACGNGKDIWTANMYYAVDNNGTIYFISQKDAKHSRMIIKNPNVAFSVAWFDSKKHTNRKGIQGLGMCRITENVKEITTGIALLYKKFPDMKDILSVKWILENAWGSKIWVLKPSYLKHWNDKLYGDEESKEFTVN